MSRKTRKLLEAMRDFSENEIAEVKGILINNEIKTLRAELGESFNELREQMNKRIISANRRVNLAEREIKKARKMRRRKR